MYYHAIIKFNNENQYIYCNNYSSKQSIVDSIVIPYVNGHVITISGTTSIVNLKTAYSITLFKTSEKLIKNESGTLIEQMKDKDFQKNNNCTKEIFNEYNHEFAAPKKSDYQRKFSEIKNQVFIIMKFSDNILDSAYEGVIKPVIKEFNMEAIRVDKIEDSGKITDQIIDYISSSKYVIADLSGERPNTYYEAGFAHALGKETILTIKRGENIHFDLSGHRFIQWETELELRNKLRERFNSLINGSESTN